jgi:chromosomal replication initiation ATPase DnaA
MKTTIDVMLSREFVEALDGAGAWAGMQESERQIYVEAMRAARKRVYGTADETLVAAVEAMCKAIGISRAVMSGTGRSQYQIKARRVITYTLRTCMLPPPSASDVAVATGRTNHSSVFTNIEDAKALIEAGDAEFIREFEACKAAIAVKETNGKKKERAR